MNTKYIILHYINLHDHDHYITKRCLCILIDVKHGLFVYYFFQTFRLSCTNKRRKTTLEPLEDPLEETLREHAEKEHQLKVAHLREQHRIKMEVLSLEKKVQMEKLELVQMQKLKFLEKTKDDND